jgi:hypothetical protein
MAEMNLYRTCPALMSSDVFSIDVIRCVERSAVTAYLDHSKLHLNFDGNELVLSHPYVALISFVRRAIRVNRGSGGHFISTQRVLLKPINTEAQTNQRSYQPPSAQDI